MMRTILRTFGADADREIASSPYHRRDPAHVEYPADVLCTGDEREKREAVKKASRRHTVPHGRKPVEFSGRMWYNEFRY
jgi:hypothetical protein